MHDIQQQHEALVRVLLLAVEQHRTTLVRAQRREQRARLQGSRVLPAPYVA
jgi:hypothetical protein